MQDTIDISIGKDPARVLKNMVLGIDGIAQVKAGTRIVYHKGQTWSLSENARKVGDMARQLEGLKRVILVQKKTGPDEYEWLAVVRA